MMMMYNAIMMMMMMMYDVIFMMYYILCDVLNILNILYNVLLNFVDSSIKIQVDILIIQFTWPYGRVSL